MSRMKLIAILAVMAIPFSMDMSIFVKRQHSLERNFHVIVNGKKVNPYL